MKKTKKSFALIVFLIAALSSCKLEDPVEPDYLSQVAQLLPEIQQNTAYFQGMELGRFQLVWMQQFGGVGGTDLLVDQYSPTSANLQKSWDDYFGTIHPKLISGITNAHQASAPAYRGICRLLLVLNLQLITDSWGDVPYEYALGYYQGYLIVPYNTQQEIYGYMTEIVDMAIEDLETALADESPKPQTNDLFYGGNLQKWIKAANLFKLKIGLRIAHKSNDYSEIASFMQDADLLSGNADDMQFTYASDQQNPFFFNDNVTKNTRVGHYFVEKLKATNDPRLPVFVKPVGSPAEYIGTQPGAANTGASFVGLNVASQTSPTFLLTYVEQKFIEAEVMLRTGQQAMADQAFEQGVKASLQKLNILDAAWESQHAEIDNVTLEIIIEAKYIALFLNPEVWTDYRRTGFPSLTPYQGTEIPRRFIYPLNEISFNQGNVPQGVTIFSRVWWDTL